MNSLGRGTVAGLSRQNLRRTKFFVSFVILFFIAAQAFAGLIYHPDYVGDSYFPFLNYPMYSGVCWRSLLQAARQEACRFSYRKSPLCTWGWRPS